MSTLTAPAPLPAPTPTPARGVRVVGVEPPQGVGPEPRGRLIPVSYRLRALREQAGVSQRRLSEITKQVDPRGQGISSFSINRYENGVHAPGYATLNVLAETLSRLLGREITPANLRVTGRLGLAHYLEGVRGLRRQTKASFYAPLGITPERASVLLAGDTLWSSTELGLTARAFPDAGLLVHDVLLEQVEPITDEPSPGHTRF